MRRSPSVRHTRVTSQALVPLNATWDNPIAEADQIGVAVVVRQRQPSSHIADDAPKAPAFAMRSPRHQVRVLMTFA